MFTYMKLRMFWLQNNLHVQDDRDKSILILVSNSQGNGKKRNSSKEKLFLAVAFRNMGWK